MPRVVTAGLPTRMPEVMKGLFVPPVMGESEGEG
jgi:hypothetical protein